MSSSRKKPKPKDDREEIDEVEEWVMAIGFAGYIVLRIAEKLLTKGR
ncbi:hypothetical protein [Chroococcidiopsis sp.]